MVMEDMGAMVTDVLDEPELRPLWGGIVQRGAQQCACGTKTELCIAVVGVRFVLETLLYWQKIRTKRNFQNLRLMTSGKLSTDWAKGTHLISSVRFYALPIPVIDRIDAITQVCRVQTGLVKTILL